ncbi:MAG: SGNH/GDSL hydrolase family protein [Deltaproteobacteria bacterium]|nr:SGNH/GDSL hydrolase family protein [Deltaproteobacteria bacterium]
MSSGPASDDSSASRGRTLLLSAVSIALILGLLELGARLLELVVAPAATDPSLGFDDDSRVFVPDGNSGELVTALAKRQAFREQRFRLEKDEHTLRICVLGESSVNQLHEELGVLASELSRILGRPVEIINAGGNSYGSHRLTRVAYEVLSYELDLLVVYLGNNEFEELEQLELAPLRVRQVSRWLDRSALARRMRDSLLSIRLRELEADHNRRILAANQIPIERAWSHAFTEAEVNARMDTFERNLRTIVELARSRRTKVLLGTVPSNLARPLLSPPDVERYLPALELMRQGRTAEGLRLARHVLATALGRHQASETENRLIRRVASLESTPLFDMERAVTEAEPSQIPGVTLFEDHCHLNAKGNALWRRTVEPGAIELLGPPAAHPR